MKKLWGIVFSIFLALFCVLISEDEIKAGTETKVIEVIWNDETVGSYSTFSGALEMYNSLDGATMKLIADYDFTSEGREFVFESSGNLDLNGYRLSHNQSEEWNELTIKIPLNVNLTIIDTGNSTKEYRYIWNSNNSNIILDDSGDIVVVGGMIDCGATHYNNYPHFEVKGNLSMLGGNLVGTSVFVYGDEVTPVGNKDSNAVFNMYGGWIVGGAGFDGEGVYVSRNGMVNIYDGKISHQNWKAIGADGSYSKNIVNIFGGIFENNEYVIAAYGNNDVNIYDGVMKNNFCVINYEGVGKLNISGGKFVDNGIGVVSTTNVYLSGNPVFENNKFDMNGMILDADIGLLQDSSMDIDAKIVITGELGEDTKINFGIVDSNFNVGVGEAVVGYNNYNTDDFKDHFGSAIPGLELASDGVNTYIVSDIKAINYELNGGEFVQQCNALTEYPVGYGAKLPVNACVVRTGYTFLGWTLSNEVEDTTYVSSIQESATEDVVVYARWKIKEYTINFYDENRTSIIKTIKVNHGSSIVPTPLEDKTPNEQYSYPFDKWVRDNNTEAVFNNIVEDMNVYATFTRKINKYTVTWKNGDEVLRIDIVEYGTIPNYEEIPVKEKSEDYTYKFIGWNKEIVAVTGNIEYSARFKPVEIEKEREIPTTAIVAGTEVVAASGLGILTVLKRRKKLL